jgi:hypothetical protein
VIVSSNLAGSCLVPRCPPGTRLAAAIDVEWSKNYRIRGGNVPFCYSVVWLPLPASSTSTILDTARFWYTSAYVEDTSQCRDLVAGADTALACLMGNARLIAGHQLCSDLAVLAAAAAGARPPAIAAAAAAWRQRRQEPSGQPRFLDTRYDAGHVLTCQSRRLVDVCADLRLEVTQPELRGTSMTALHRRWLELGDIPAREKITVLNLRHSLSTAMVAARAAGLAHWQPGLNVNKVLAAELSAAFGWLAHPVFTALLGEADAA